MFRKYKESDFDELLRLRCLLYTNYSKDELNREIKSFMFQPHNNPFRNYDSWTSFVYQKENGELGGFIDIGLIYAKDYLENLNHFIDTDYFGQIQQHLSLDYPIPLVESWYVEEVSRGKHIGSELMKLAEQWIKDKGYLFILSDTDDFREVSKKAHKAYGYDNYYVDNNGCHYFYKQIK